MSLLRIAQTTAGPLEPHNYISVISVKTQDSSLSKVLLWLVQICIRPSSRSKPSYHTNITDRLPNSLANKDLDSIGYLFRLLFSLHSMTLRYLYVRRLIKQYYCAKRAFRVIEIGFANVRSFDMKTFPRISRKPFDLESPNLIGTSITLHYITLNYSDNC